MRQGQESLQMMEAWGGLIFLLGVILILVTLLLRRRSNKWPFFFVVALICGAMALQSWLLHGFVYSKGLPIQIGITVVFLLMAIAEAKFSIWERLGRRTR
jgi:hypothetical protein